MELKEAILNRRTRRKFTNKKVEHHKLEELVEYARYAPTGQNLQPLKYCIVDDEEMVKKYFRTQNGRDIIQKMLPQKASSQHHTLQY